MEKQAAWAAAMSSSGLVLPLAASVRAFHVTSNVPRPEVARLVVPEPSVRLPFHTAFAERVAAMFTPQVDSYRGRPVPGPAVSHPRDLAPGMHQLSAHG